MTSPRSQGLRLRIIHLDDTLVDDLSPIAGCKNLERLLLDGTNVRDVSPLTGLTNLRRLSLSRTPVRNLSPLARLANLGDLNVPTIAVPADQLAMLRRALPNCEIQIDGILQPIGRGLGK